MDWLVDVGDTAARLCCLVGWGFTRDTISEQEQQWRRTFLFVQGCGKWKEGDVRRITSDGACDAQWEGAGGVASRGRCELAMIVVASKRQWDYREAGNQKRLHFVSPTATLPFNCENRTDSSELGRIKPVPSNDFLLVAHTI